MQELFGGRVGDRQEGRKERSKLQKQLEEKLLNSLFSLTQFPVGYPLSLDSHANLACIYFIFLYI